MTTHVADRVRSLRDHAQEGRHHHAAVGYNYRMEGVQGAVLGVKLRHLAAWTDGAAEPPPAIRSCSPTSTASPCRPSPPGADPAWHLYVIRVDDRDRVGRELNEAGIGTGVHYPTPVHLQPAYADLGYGRGSFPHAESFMPHAVSRCRCTPRSTRTPRSTSPSAPPGR